MIVRRAYAKINWSLIVNEKLADSYHSLDTLMQKISLYDTVSFEESDDISCQVLGDFDVPSGESNIAYKAAKLLLEYSNKKCGIKMIINKNIPSGAGLGGGSSDAACVLKTLNELLGINLEHDELSKLALKLGADVPYFLKSGLCHACNKGEILTPLNMKNSYYLVLIKHGEALSTKKIFESLSEVNAAGSLSHDNSRILKIYRALYDGNMQEYRKTAVNDLQAVSERYNNYISSAISKLNEHKAEHAIMTGSGSAVFGVFTSYENAYKCFEAIKSLFDFVTICKTIDD